MENKERSWTASPNISSTYFQTAVREGEININADHCLGFLIYLGNGE